MTNPMAPKTVLVLIACLSLMAPAVAWEYVYDPPPPDCRPWLAPDQGDFNFLTIDSQSNLIACGSFGTSPTAIHIVKVGSFLPPAVVSTL